MSTAGQGNSQQPQEQSQQFNDSTPVNGSRAGIANDVASVFARNSPLSLLNLDGNQPVSTPAILDPQKVANDIAVQRELDRIETEKRNNPQPVAAPVPYTAPPILSSHDPAATPPVVSSDSAPAPVDKSNSPDDTSALDKALNGEEDASTTPDKELAADGTEEEDPLADIPDEPQAANFKKLREKTKSYAEKVKELTKQQIETKARLEEFETGAVIPDVLKEKEERIAQLEPLEKLHSLKTSPEFRNKYVQPLNHIGSRLQDLADNYDVSSEDVHHALQITNTRDLDAFLVDRFGNTIGASNAKELIQRAQGLQQESYEALQHPEQALSALAQEAEHMRVIEETNRVNGIKHVSKSAWINAVNEIREEGISQELIPGDADHNNRFVTPIQTAASREYGKIMVALAGAQIKDIPEEVAKQMAKHILLSHASAVNRARATSAEQHIAVIEKTAERNNYIDRPNLTGRGGTGAVNTNPQSSRPATAEAMGRQQLIDMGIVR